MRRLLMGGLATGLIVAAVAMSGRRDPVGEWRSGNGLDIVVEERNPWTHLRVNNHDGEFQFAVVSDRSGGHRARIFSQAVQHLNLLQPEFVLSVGDLIEGYTEDAKQLAAEWQEFQGYVSQLQMPFFYVPGNHDIGNRFMRAHWRERFGRLYYHFVYRDVLFLLLNSDDGRGNYIGREQLAYVERLLQQYPSARWTLVALHKPLWTRADVADNGWLQIEKLLGERRYTVFAGHEHQYRKFSRNGRSYYQLATTGGVSRLRGVRYGEFDHIVWVTMKKDGPLLANVLLNGVYADDLQLTPTTERGTSYAQKAAHPVKGKVLLDGCPIPQSLVRFWTPPEKGKPAEDIADGLVDADGSFTLTTYSANDGAPAGPYVVTVTWPDPIIEPARPPEQLPTRYGRPETTPLRARVHTGVNDFTFQLRK